MPNRPYRTIATPLSPRPGNNQAHDFRDFGRPFDTVRQPDEARIDRVADLVEPRILDIARYIDRLTAGNIPPQLVQASKAVYLVAVTKPLILVKKNLRRQSFTVANFGASVIVFSFDAPVQMGATALIAGIPIVAGGYYQEANASVSINDIWVGCNDAAAAYPYPVLGYEGTLSLAGNVKQGN